MDFVLLRIYLLYSFYLFVFLFLIFLNFFENLKFYLEENKEHEEEDEYSDLRAPGCTGTHQVIKRRKYESFELKLKSM